MTDISTTDLPFNIDDLINRRSFEGNRVEFKSSWTEPIRAQVIRTIGAFANDFLNLNGGYIILGIEEENAKPILPPKGLNEGKIDQIQRQINDLCKTIQPTYFPVLFPTYYQNKPILIVFAPGGDNRPYQAPEDVNKKQRESYYYIRLGSQTKKAVGECSRATDDRRSAF